MQEEIHECNPGFIVHRFQLCRTLKSVWLSKRLMFDIYKQGKIFSPYNIKRYMVSRPMLLHAAEYLTYYKAVEIK